MFAVELKISEIKFRPQIMDLVTENKKFNPKIEHTSHPIFLWRGGGKGVRKV
jgi:hypothetical protein